jgi:pilus assembly protein CpaE
VSGLPLFCDPNASVAEALRLRTGGQGLIFTDLGTLRDHLTVAFEEDTIVLGPGVSPEEAFAVADYMRVHRPSLGVILVRAEVTTELLQQALRAGMRNVVELTDPAGLVAAVRHSAHLASALREAGPLPVPDAAPRSAAPPRGKLIVLFSPKGGCGKTTLATNLGAALADRGRRQVCVADLDLAWGDVAVAMQLYPAHTIADALRIEGALDGAAVRAMLTHHSPGLTALVAPTEPSTAERIGAGLVSQLLEAVRAEVDYLVVDTSRHLDDHTLAALEAADQVYLVVTPEIPALKNLKIAIETLGELGFPRDRLRLVLNRADSKVGLSVAEIEKTARLPVLVQIPSSRDVVASVNRGVPIVQEDPKHAVSQAIRELAERHVATGNLAAEPAMTTELRSDRRGLIRKRRPKTT